MHRSPYLTIPELNCPRSASPTPSHDSVASSQPPNSPFSNRSTSSSFTDLSETLEVDAPEHKNASPTRAFPEPRTTIATFLAGALSIYQAPIYKHIRYGKKGSDFYVCLQALGIDHSSIADVTAHLVAQFVPNAIISRMWIAGDFVNFKCATSSLANVVLRTVFLDPDYGFYDDGQGRNIIVEYSSPNIAKPFHIGHLRPTILGAFLRNLYVKLHWDVNAMNYLGDWGTQFALIFVGYDQYGNEDALIADPCKHLFDVYVKVNKEAKTDVSIMLKAAEFFKRMEDREEEAVNWWARIRKLTIQRYEADYHMLNAHFDTFSAESMVSKVLQDDTLSALRDLGIIVDEEMKDNPGFIAQRVDLEQYHLGKGVLRKGNGTSIYLSRDVAEAVRRYQECQFDKMIYVVASQQDVHLARVMKILELREFHWAVNGQIEHINHGLISGPKKSDGQNTKFSTRNGQVTFLDETIHGITASIQAEMRRHSRVDGAIAQQQVAQELAISLLKINDFSRRRIRDYAADWSHPEIYLPSGKKLARDNGLFIQFTYARLASLRRRNADLLINTKPEAVDTSLLIGDDVHRLIFLLGKYPDVIDAALATHQPCKIVHFTFDLCKSVRRLWKSAPVFQEKDQELARARMFMFDCALKVLKSAMELLTLRPQESF